MKIDKSALITAVLLLAACSSEDALEGTNGTAPAPTDATDAVITINGGKPQGTIGAQTRAVNQPAQPGTCQADKMKIWFYVGGTAESQSASDLTLQSTIDLDVVNTSQPAAGVTDRWAKRSLTYTYDYWFDAVLSSNDYFHYNHFAMPALAYSQTDADRFTLNGVTDGESKYTTATLTVNDPTSGEMLNTPELFFGRLRLNTTGDVTGTYSNDWNNDGHLRYKYEVKNANNRNPKEFTFPITGHLYRMVGQININMTEVPTDMVEKIEILMTNVPRKVGLYGTHGNVYGQNEIGRFYPVTAAKSPADCIGEKTLVASTTDFTNDEAHLSFFLLPSEVGGKLYLRVHFKDGTVKNADGSSILEHDYDVKPARSALLTGDDASVYNVDNIDMKEGTDLYVYNSIGSLFYSYANVRVNISGLYDDFTVYEQEVDVNIEVEPGYEREHTITILK